MPCLNVPPIICCPGLVNEALEFCPIEFKMPFSIPSKMLNEHGILKNLTAPVPYWSCWNIKFDILALVRRREWFCYKLYNKFKLQPSIKKKFGIPLFPSGFGHGSRRSEDHVHLKWWKIQGLWCNDEWERGEKLTVWRSYGRRALDQQVRSQGECEMVSRVLDLADRRSVCAHRCTHGIWRICQVS